MTGLMGTSAVVTSWNWNVVSRRPLDMTENEPQTGLPPDSHTDVTASEVASYAYCAKAWHLRYVMEREPARQASVRQHAGVVAHETHGVRVARLAWLERRAAIVVVGLLLVGAALLTL